jgi:NADH-quinone oxidoreductase subunit L
MSISRLVATLRFAYTLLGTTQNGVLSRYALVISTGAVFFLGYWLW